MELQSLANLGEFIGGIGVIVSLIYVASQVKSNTQSQRNDIAARTLERLGSLQREMVTNRELNSLVNIALSDVYKLDVMDRVRFAWWCTEFFSAMESLHDQHQQKNVQAGIWERWQSTFRWWLTYPGILEWWRCKPTPFSKDFTAYVEAMKLEGFQYADVKAWKEFLKPNDTKE